MVWGNKPLVANSDGAYGHWVTDVLERGSKLMVVDPKLTWLAAHADLWLQVRPGSDGALALGICNVLISEGLYGADFCAKWVYGLEEFGQMAAEWTPEKTEEVTWVPAEKIVAAAHLIAENSPALLQWGVALDQRIDCVDGARAVLDIFALTGNIEKPGSMIVPPELLKYITGWGRDFLSFDAEEKRIGTDELIFYKMGLQVASINKMIDHMIEQPEDYPIKASWIQTVNEIACGGVDNERTKQAFGNLEFNVIVDLFMTPTAMAFGDLFLPVATYGERNGIRAGDGCQRGETINRAIPPAGECRSDMEINLELGRRWNPEAWPWDTVEDMFDSILEETGMGFTQVREYPLVLTTGARRHNTFHSENRQSPHLRALHPEPAVQMNPKLAARIGVAEGDWVWVEGPVGTTGRVARAKRVVELTPGLDERVVSSDHGWWRPEADPEKLFDVDELNINNLISWESGETGVGANYKCILCKVYPVKEGE